MSAPSPIFDAAHEQPAGYASRAYAEALAELGAPIELPHSGGWLLERPTHDAGAADAMGPYPLFACRDWSRLADDLAALPNHLIAASLVTDPFANATPATLHAAFPDVCYAYKQHYVTDLSQPLDRTTPTNHRRNIRKALAAVEVEQPSPDAAALVDWIALYDHLVERHAIHGIARFSPASFAQQFRVPGLTIFSAYANGERVGMTLWYESNGISYYHLAAYSEWGYQLGASFALFATALAHFAKAGQRWAALGAGAGTTAAESGLTRFKQGWATDTRTAYFCGRILQAERYRRLAAHAPPTTTYFPAYRAA
jgi:hypothetical protein